LVNPLDNSIEFAETSMNKCIIIWTFILNFYLLLDFEIFQYSMAVVSV
jgi:hypothetical protein